MACAFQARLCEMPWGVAIWQLWRGVSGRPYSVSGHVVHGRKLGRGLGASKEGAEDGFRTLNLRFSHWKPAASGIFNVEVHGLTPQPLIGVANLGIRPLLNPHDVNGGRVLLETHCLDWHSTASDPEGGCT